MTDTESLRVYRIDLQGHSMKSANRMRIDALIEVGVLVEIEPSEVEIIVRHDGGLVQTPHNWHTYELEDGVYKMVKVRELDDE